MRMEIRIHQGYVILRFLNAKQFSIPNTWYRCQVLDKTCFQCDHCFGKSYFTFAFSNKKGREFEFINEVNVEDGNNIKWTRLIN